MTRPTIFPNKLWYLLAAALATPMVWLFIIVACYFETYGEVFPGRCFALTSLGGSVLMSGLLIAATYFVFRRLLCEAHPDPGALFFGSVIAVLATGATAVAVYFLVALWPCWPQFLAGIPCRLANP